MIFIPEIKIYEIVKAMVDHLKEDHDKAQDKNKSMLGYMLGDNDLLKKDYFDEAVSIFSRKNGNPRQLRTRLYYDMSKATVPTIHITIPQEMQDQSPLGTVSGEEIPVTLPVNSSNEGKIAYRSVTQRRFRARTHIIITSDNESEVTLIYHVMRAMIMSTLDHFSLVGLENVVIGGQEVRVNERVAPDHIFHRGIEIGYSYLVCSPNWYDQQDFANILISKLDGETNSDFSPKLVDDEH